MLAAIEEAGFEGRPVDGPATAPAREGVRLDVSVLPETLRAAFARAKEQGRLVLVDVHGPG
jgi:hypothetical protein